MLKMSEINNEFRKRDVLVYRNGAVSLINEILNGKDIDWCCQAIWVVLIKPGKQSYIKETKALKWLENVMKKGKFKDHTDLMLILDVFTDLLNEEA